MNYIFILLLLCSSALAQNTISGTLYANDVKGFLVIGCLLDLAANDCDYDQSPYVTIEQSGPSATFVLENAPDGSYLVIAWHDTNGNGSLEDDGTDALTYYTDANGDPVSVTPPASDITLRIAASSNPLTSQPSSNPLTTNPPPTTSTDTDETNLSTTVATSAPSIFFQPSTNLNVPTEYVGVWSDNTAAYSISFLLGAASDTFSSSLSMSGGMGAGGRVLKIYPDGSYEFYEGESNNLCFTSVTSKGTVSISPGNLILYPQQKWELSAKVDDTAKCDVYDREVTPTPESYSTEFSEYDGLYGYKTYFLTWPMPGTTWAFEKVIGVLPPSPQAQPMPSDFVVGQAVAFRELSGHWFAAYDETVPVDFYDRATGQVSAAEYASSLTLSDDGSYEIIVYRPDVHDVPACTKNLLLVERGTTRFETRRVDEYGQKYYGGDVVLTPTSSELTTKVTTCGTDDFKETVSLPLSPRYLTFQVTMANTVSGELSTEDTFVFECPSEYTGERTEWLFMFCTSEVNLIGEYQRR
jgi:hypothetical protein